LYTEKQLETEEGILRALATLEQDEGVRVECDYDGKKCYVFITKPSSSFVLSVYERSSDDTPGARVETSEFTTYEELSKAMRRLLRGKFRAFRY
jgi:hypothetical protein